MSAGPSHAYARNSAIADPNTQAYTVALLSRPIFA